MKNITAYKAFNADWTCRGFQYEVGGTYTHDGKTDVCKSGFHACENPLETFQHYDPTGKFAAVEMSGEISKSNDGDTKIASAKITITAEISLHDFIGRAVAWLTANAKDNLTHATGEQSAASATGYRSAASATGDRSAASATGYRSAASATGYQSAASATGDQSAASATGDRSAASATGDRSAASANHAGATALGAGRYCAVSGVIGSALHLNEWDADGKNIVAVWAGIVGRDGVKDGQSYMLTDGKLTEVN